MQLETSQPFARNINPESGGVPATLLEMHCVQGSSLCFGINMIAAIFSNCSLYRAVAVLMQVLFAAVDAYSYLRLGKEIPFILYFMIGVGRLGNTCHGTSYNCQHSY